MTKITSLTPVRNGITLLEIILSIVILAGTLAVLANLSRTGMLNAIRSKEMTQAQFLCESLLAKLVTGILDLEPVFDEPVRDFPDTGASNPYDSNEILWLYSVEINTIHDDGLLEVIVTVTKNEETGSRPVSYRLVRWMIDKEVVAEVLAEREESDSSSESSTSTSSSSGSSGTSGTTSRGGVSQ